MSQSDIPHGLCSTDEQPPSGAVDVAIAPDSALEADRLSAELNSLAIELESTAAATTQDSATRICDLENALDQAMACLADFKGRIQNQDFLEAQLAKTEEFASVQHQAIACLKQRLHYFEQSLRVRDQVLLAIVGLASFALLQQVTSNERNLEVLATPELPKQLSLPLDLTSSADAPADAQDQLAIAHQHISHLTSHITRLEIELKQAATYLEERQVLELTLRQTKTLATERDTAIAALRKELAIAQIKVEELETELVKQHKLQAKWQQTHQELEQERDRHLTRIADLERDVAEMQEQIFQQARQASEYETAVQHWKDRYLSHQRHLAHLSHLLEQAIPHSLSDSETSIPVTPILVELFTLLQEVGNDPTSDPELLSAVPSPRFNKLDLPEFLMRRRNFRTR
ncbi:MAG: hypothetical protein SFY66_24715 [Oculatellaceae cyanobacterium bins.114]|nr:hypothetical protein [Oculatellaceae cyanobacterium bins.114]